ncbi:MAG: hypothetical protein J0L82_04435 [Deltaproteobacteria bacterium]|jgi:hypothetical protein|nr:hypothetical protein [Deltaproteobacteria bacterium]
MSTPKTHGHLSPDSGSHSGAGLPAAEPVSPFFSDTRNVGPATFLPGGLQFQFVETADGSLTARLGESETMHSLRGAFNETVYIYGTAFAVAQNELGIKEPTVFSLGLGLGYVEILSAALALKSGAVPRGKSFELIEELNTSFKSWALAKVLKPTMTPDVFVLPDIYDQIARRTCDAMKSELVTPDTVCRAIGNALLEKSWTLSGPLTPQTEMTRKFDCIAFDAFSSKSTPELWTREFLDHFLATACNQSCVLSTYACTGNLKRALVDAGFELRIREGYASKRDSTLAVRR